MTLLVTALLSFALGAALGGWVGYCLGLDEQDIWYGRSDDF